MRQVPFYPNHEDDMHCMLAVYRSILDYFINRKMSWEEIEDFTGFKPGKAAWSLKTITHLTAMGFDIRMIEPFDYATYSIEGEPYLEEIWGPEKLEWQIENTNILEIQQYIPEFLKKVTYENRTPQLADIDAMLAEGRLVNVMLNAAVLNNTPDYTDHSILILDKVGNEYIAHDPGLPPVPNRHIPAELLWEAMGGDNNTVEVTGFKLKKRRNLRLDQYVIEQHPLLSRAYAVRLIDEGKVLVNGNPSKAGYKVRERDTVLIDYDESQTTATPEIDLPILYEDDDCIVIDKPAGVLTHTVGKLHGEASVASFIRSRLHNMPAPDVNTVGIRNSKVNQDNLRAGIVHRLDRATSGVIICAKTPEALSWLQKQFHDRHAIKTYGAVISGHIRPHKAVIDMPIERNPKSPATFRVGANGKQAVTAYKTLQSNEKHSLLELLPRTGRTHQLRVHLAHQNHPIVGDYMYDGEKADRLYLHAWRLHLTLPNGEEMTFEAPLPEAFNTLTLDQ